jgi:hypothetical protein
MVILNNQLQILFEQKEQPGIKCTGFYYNNQRLTFSFSTSL